MIQSSLRVITVPCIDDHVAPCFSVGCCSHEVVVGNYFYYFAPPPWPSG